jgi:hypothetical protein
VAHKIVVFGAQGVQLDTTTLCATADVAQMFDREKRSKYLISNKAYIFLQCNVLCFDNAKDMRENFRNLQSAARGSDERTMKVETKRVTAAAVIKFVRRMAKYTWTSHNIQVELKPESVHHWVSECVTCFDV